MPVKSVAAGVNATLEQVRVQEVAVGREGTVTRSQACFIEIDGFMDYFAFFSFSITFLDQYNKFQFLLHKVTDAVLLM